MISAASVPADAPPGPRLFPLVSLYELFEQVYRPERLAASPPGTIIQYRVQLGHLQRYWSTAEPGPHGPMITKHLTREAIVACRAWLIQQGRSVATANKFARHVAALWRFAIEEGLIDEPVRPIRRLKEPKRKARAWKLSEVSRILAALPGPGERICGLRASSWWKAFLLVMYDTGLRISTMMDLRWEYFYYSAREGLLRIPAEIVKDDEDLVHELSAQSLAALLAIRGSGSASIFPWSCDRDRSWRALRNRHRKILQAAGLPWKSRRDGGFHKYRATTASYLKRGGGDSTEHLGHSTPAVTALYLDRTICRPRQVDLLPRPKLADPDPQMRLF